MDLLVLLVVALLTFILEYPIVLLFYRKRGCRHLFLFTLLINLLTNLLLNCALLLFSGTGYVFALIIGEILVFLIEFFLLYEMYPREGAGRAALTSAAANLFSLLAGAVIMVFLFFPL